jgi:hypothetical protein
MCHEGLHSSPRCRPAGSAAPRHPRRRTDDAAVTPWPRRRGRRRQFADGAAGDRVHHRQAGTALGAGQLIVGTQQPHRETVVRHLGTAQPRQRTEHRALGGAERIRGELLKLGIRVSGRTIQKYPRRLRGPRPRRPSWATFLRTHSREIWACDFLQVYDLFFRPLSAFFVIELDSQRVAHSAATRTPSSAWVTQQLREATAWGRGPRSLIRDDDDKFGHSFDALRYATGIQRPRTPVRAPNATAV